MKDEALVAFASWARLSDVVAQRYMSVAHQLALADWNSGDQIWLIDVFTPFGGAQDVLKDLREKVFEGKDVRQLAPTAPTQTKALTWPAIGAPSSH